MSKAECMADEVKFQRACSNLVSRGVIYCVSSLMYDIGQNLEASAKIFDFDYDEAIDWYGREDYEEPVEEYIRGLSREEVVKYLEGRSIQRRDEESIEILREAMFEDVKTESLEDFARKNRIEPYEIEVYEHWIVDSWFARQLEAHGEVVFEFDNMTIWGRCTTGQGISQDGVVREIVREQEDYSWIWEE